jgi:catechol 2,3-dioxygenase-like lactoylglutathione lyase family enzyme
MLTNAQISYIFLYVRDLAVTRQFYEQKLGFRVVEEDGRAAKYDAGDVMLALNRASDFDLTLSDSPEALLVFHTPNVERVAHRLRQNGVAVGPLSSYEIGTVAELKDPDGHELSLYEPSPEALDWPSADKIRTIVGLTTSPRSRNGNAGGTADVRKELLGAYPLIYLFLFVRDVAEAAGFYGKVLGLNSLEHSACSAGGPDNGVVKYDGGGIILTTHHADRLTGKAFDRSRHRGLAVVFNVDNIERTTDELRTSGLRFDSSINSSEIGKIIRFSDPNGHSFYLHEPSVSMGTSPSGRKVSVMVTKYAGQFSNTGTGAQQ